MNFDDEIELPVKKDENDNRLPVGLADAIKAESKVFDNGNKPFDDFAEIAQNPNYYNQQNVDYNKIAQDPSNYYEQQYQQVQHQGYPYYNQMGQNMYYGQPVQENPNSILYRFKSLPKEQQRKIYFISIGACFLVIGLYLLFTYMSTFGGKLTRNYMYSNGSAYIVFYKDGICSDNGNIARKCRYQENNYGMLIVDSTGYSGNIGYRYYFGVGDDQLKMLSAYYTVGGLEQREYKIRGENIFKLTNERQPDKRRPIEIQYGSGKEESKDV